MGNLGAGSVDTTEPPRETRRGPRQRVPVRAAEAAATGHPPPDARSVVRRPEGDTPRAVKFLHTSDWQLGMTRHFLAGEAQARFTGDRFEAVRRLAEVAREQGCAFCVVAGDVFDSNQLDRSMVRRGLEAMRAFDVPLILLPGNHDLLDASSVYRGPVFEREKPDGVIVIDDETPLGVPGLDGVELVGVPCREKHPARDPVAERLATLDRAPAGRRRILLAHGGMDALSGDHGQASTLRAATLRAALDDGRIHYVALGDRHSYTAVEGDERIVYSGAPEATDFSERDAGTAAIVGDDWRAARVAIGRWRFLRHDVDLVGDEGIDALERFLDELDDKERVIVRLGLRGTLTLRQSVRLDAIVERAAETCASVHHSDNRQDLVIKPQDAEFDDLPVTGYARTAMHQLLDQAASGGDGAEAARDGLALLARLVGGWR